ncbi:MAG: nucleotidyltransferase family protein [bacterium]
MKNTEQIKSLISANLETIKKRFDVASIGVFGSYVRDEQREDSDLDIIVVFEPGHNDLFNYARLKAYLEELFGIEIDLVIKNGIKPELRDKILGEVQYA